MGFSTRLGLAFAALCSLRGSGVLAAPAPASSTSSSNALPVVDLGYELQQASLYNSTGGYYNFSNIRYAAPPTGEFRFAAPQPPAVNRSVVQTGSPGRICPQAGPAWFLIAEQFIPEYLEGQTQFNSSSFNQSTGGGLPAQDPRTTEDCLFLDVVVPKDIFENAGKEGCGAPVLVWIYGGGYTEGDKTDSGNPAGLLARSEANNSTGVIYVAMNYRLGAFGWQAGPTFQASGGVANAGLYDQRFALEWVQQHIAKFGGDPNRVTVFGESAGGGSIMHQITAYGGNAKPVFQQAVTQSAAFDLVPSPVEQEAVYAEYLKLLKVTSLAELRALPYVDLQTANIVQVGGSPYGQFSYGPVVDGVFAPALPGQLLARGQFNKDLKVMVGHNSDEGLLFTTPFVQNNAEFRQKVESLLPTVNAFPSVVDYITNVLYPPVFDGSQAMGYTNQIARLAAAVSESTFTCNTFYLDKAFGNNTYSYLFAVPPGLHGEDVPFTYYNGPNPGVLAPALAIALQEYITHFAETGTPNEKGVPVFPLYTDKATIQVLNVTGITEAVDPTANYRCDWWQKALFY